MKIDVTKIKGYAEMSAEDKIKALEAFEYEDRSDEVSRLMKAKDDANAEAAKYKKELKEKMSAEEIKAKEDAEKQTKLQADYDALLRKVSISDNKAKLIALGYEEKLAEDTAEAMLDGNLAKVIANQKSHLETAKKQIEAELLKKTPVPNQPGKTETANKTDFAKMSYAERVALYSQNKEQYEQMKGTEENGNDS